MTTSDIRSLELLLGEIRSIHDELAERHAGLAVLHMDAAMAALESHIRRQKVSDSPATFADATAG